MSSWRSLNHLQRFGVDDDDDDYDYNNGDDDDDDYDYNNGDDGDDYGCKDGEYDFYDFLFTNSKLPDLTSNPTLVLFLL